jgi:hypothetical protein
MDQSKPYRIEAEAAQALREWKAFFAEQVCLEGEAVGGEKRLCGRHYNWSISSGSEYRRADVGDRSSGHRLKRWPSRSSLISVPGHCTRVQTTGFASFSSTSKSSWPSRYRELAHGISGPGGARWFAIAMEGLLLLRNVLAN